MASLERQHFWGCTLTKEKPEVKWLATEDKQEMEVDILNQLALSQACLGAKANDNESHVVQVITTGVNSNVIKQPIIILGNKVKQVQCRLEFSAAATFKLVEGRGPVYLSGSHVQVLANEFSEMEDESEDEIPKAIPAGKPLLVEKHPSTSPNKQPAAKRAKLDLSNDVSDEDSDNDEDSEEEEGDEPTELIPLKGAKPSNKPKNTKTPLKNGKPPQKKNEKSNLAEDKAEDKAEEESEGSVDEDESEEDDANDDDFDAPDSDEDDDDDDDDGDDDDDDDDDDSDEESGLEDEITNTIVAKKKLRNQQNEKTTPEKRTPRKALDASIPLQKTPDITTVKQRLLKSPNLPKSMDKFKNFMKTNMKITEDKTVKELWTWLKKNKK